jgi:hypothetical protein
MQSGTGDRGGGGTKRVSTCGCVRPLRQAHLRHLLPLHGPQVPLSRYPSRLFFSIFFFQKLTYVASSPLPLHASHYTALSTLRSELFAAIFEGYQDAQSDTNRTMGGVEASAGGGVSRSVGGGGGGRWGAGGLPSSRQAEEQNTHIHAASSSSQRAAAPYAALTPYFVQVHRLRETKSRKLNLSSIEP